MSTFRRNESRHEQILPYAALLITWALVHFGLVLLGDSPLYDTQLITPDSYMRMVRVTELVQNWQWFDGTIDRANAPYGDTLHWTRPFDVLLILLALPAGIVLGADQALHLAGIIVSPLLHLATGLTLVWALRPVIRPEVWFLPAVAFFLQPGVLAYSILGYADHHSLLLLIFVVVAGFALRALRNPLDARPALQAGIAAGIGIWLSVEFLMIVGVCIAALGLPWLFGERERAGQNKWFALGMSLVLLGALFVERPFARFLEPSYDRVSAVQFLFAVSVLLFWRTVETLQNRALHPSRFFGRAVLGVAGAAALGLLFATTYPTFFSGPMAEVDPRILPIWLDRVLEMRPLVPTDRKSLGDFVFYLGGIALIAPLFLMGLIAQRGSSRFFALLFIAIACLLLTAAAVQHMRFSVYAETAFVIAFAVILDRFLHWSGRLGNDLLRGLLRGGFLALTLLGPLFVGASLMVKEVGPGLAADQPPAACEVPAVAAFLETDPRWAQGSQTILAFMDIGPELLYRTRHRVIGTPYHRNGNGIFDGHQMLATSDEAVAHDVAERRGIDLVLLCQSPAERRFYQSPRGEENLYHRLEHGRPPTWLAAVPLPSHLQGQARLYRVVR
ncbi:MAG: hypothetical protein ACFCUT_08110 [Kiloniellaceae bacterium]